MQIQGVMFAKGDVKKLLELSTIDSHDVEKIIYPKDKQNVPTATACLLKFVDVITTDKINLISYKLYQIQNELKLLAAVYERPLCLSLYVELSLSKQIQMVSKAIYSLLVLFQLQEILFILKPMPILLSIQRYSYQGNKKIHVTTK